MNGGSVAQDAGGELVNFPEDSRLQEPIKGIPLVFVDVETTGLSPAQGDRVCEIALLRVCGEQEEDSFVTLVNPGRPISAGASAVNGITDSMVHDAPPFVRVAGAVMKILKGSVLVAHNAPFDLGFLRNELLLAGHSVPSFRVIDTLELARRCFSFPGNGLQEICRALRIEVSDQHRALADCRTTWRVFSYFLKVWETRGVVSLGQILELQGAKLVSGGGSRW